jgi:hypothetical protein|tara:strand:+ start:2655 stop:2843 length:189 start_codon:yes stop_codon:yes gene_type:complete
MKNIFNIFKKKKTPIIIPLYQNGKETGTWIECFKGDSTWKSLVKIYGTIPPYVETELYNGKD